MKSTDIKFTTERNYARADSFLKSVGFSHTHSRRAFLAGLVTVNGRKIVKSTPLAAKETVVVAFADEETNLAPSPMKQKICYEDEDILVIDKGVIPAMPCKMYPDHTLANELCGYFQSKGLKRKVRMLGRLDKETTGLLVVAKNPYAYGVLEKDRTKNKSYLALVNGEVAAAGTVDAPIGIGDASLVRVVRDDGQAAITHFRPIHRGKVSLLEIQLDTGRTHQIRCHMAHIGHPILGDELYGGGRGGVHLHVHKISLVHPRTKAPMVFTSPMPEAWLKFFGDDRL
ncbi:RluA family pseudouridine synthase [Peptoniphilus sp. EMRHCC_23]|uniref:RluA family pseudouridine synthase n=1 Tax=Peptoniphilus rachelemmaiella TaxID=2811779 RepID=UPI001BFFDCDB|nr:RluA family pseudouridine synthase [Peptoniphilus rachelemmaiella]